MCIYIYIYIYIYIFILFIYLAAPGLSRDMQDLWDLAP